MGRYEGSNNGAVDVATGRWPVIAATGQRPVLRAPFDRRGLARRFFDLDAKQFRREVLVDAERFPQPARDVAREQFGGGVLDGQQDAVAARELPLAVRVLHLHALRCGINGDHRVLGGDEQAEPISGLAGFFESRNFVTRSP